MPRAVQIIPQRGACKFYAAYSNPLFGSLKYKSFLLSHDMCTKSNQRWEVPLKKLMNLTL